MTLIGTELSAEQKERQANWRTHDFTGIDGRCFWCDVRPWSAYADEKCPEAIRKGTVI